MGRTGAKGFNFEDLSTAEKQYISKSRPIFSNRDSLDKIKNFTYNATLKEQQNFSVLSSNVVNMVDTLGKAKASKSVSDDEISNSVDDFVKENPTVNKQVLRSLINQVSRGKHFSSGN